jgi:casein kinase II subunit beta
MSARTRSPRSRSADLRQPVKPPPPPEIPRDWKRSYLRQEGNAWLSDIPDEYISDRFNVFGLAEQFYSFSACCDVILGRISSSSIPASEARSIIEELPAVYGLIHARYIMSPEGLESVREKYEAGVYGTCPRLRCSSERVLPIGVCSDLGKASVKVFCPCCREIYDPKGKQSLDGAYFGPNMAHIFLDETDLARRRRHFQPYVHTAFGFKVKP